MKRLIIYSLALLLVFSFNTAKAGDTAENMPRFDEVAGWANSVADYVQSQNLPLVETNQTELGFEKDYDSISLFYASQSDDAKLVGVKLKDAVMPGPRGEMIFDEQSTLLSLYTNDNKDLVGDKDFATLYVNNEMPEFASFGLVTRDGQRIQSIEYDVNSLIEQEEYDHAKLFFEIQNGSIASIAVYGLNAPLLKQQVQENLTKAEEMSTLNTYHAFKTSPSGEDLAVFEREDLMFSGLDYYSLTPEILLEKFGEPDTDDTETADTIIRTLTWDAIDASFLVNKKGETIAPYRLTIKDDVIEGPRGLRVGDTYPDVYRRFRSEGHGVDENGVELLYGKMNTPPYATVTYYPDGVEMTMVQSVGEKNPSTVVLNLNFNVDKLEEITLYTE